MNPLTIRETALTTAAVFFESQGVFGFEGTAMLAGTADDGITRCVIPAQHARRSRLGVSVEVTDQGKLELASALSDGEIYLARIHSHPGEAFHSDTDDSNPVLTSTGALSIVVPYFGLGLRAGIGACAVYEFASGVWNAVDAADVLEAVEVVTG